MESIKQNKAFWGMAIASLLLIIGGVFLFSKPSTSTDNSGKVNSAILAPDTAYKTSTGSAEITLVEFGDFQCPACGVYHPFVKQLLTEAGNRVNFIFRNFPLTQHQNAPMASYAAEAAGLQGKYWQMHDKLFETQSEWSNLSDPKSKFVEYAKSLGLDTDKFSKDIDLGSIKDKVQKDESDGNLVGINATPTFYVNGVKIDLPNTYEQFKALVLTSK